MFGSRSWWLAPSLFLLLSVLALGTWSRFRSMEREAAQEQLNVVAAQTAERIEDFVGSRLFLVENVRSTIARGGLDNAEVFVQEAGALQQRFPGLQAINWVRPDGVIEWVSPVEPNFEAKGKNIFDNPVAGPVLRCAMEENRPCMTPPIDLFQGGRGFATYYPVHSSDAALLGCVNGVFRIDQLLEEVLGGSSFLEKYRLHLDDQEVGVYGDHQLERARLHAHSSITLLDRQWDLTMTPVDSAWVGIRRDGNYPFLVGGIALAAALAMAVFITQQRAQHQQRERLAMQELQEHLHEAQKMEAIGQLSGGVAHDFNNLLTSVTGNTSLALDLPDLPPRARGLLDRVLLACDRATDLTSHLLTLSRRQNLSASRIGLNQMIESELPLLRVLLRDKVALELQLDPSVQQVPMHPTQLSQVLLNLTGNARDAMPQGGTLVLSTRIEARDPKGRNGPWAVLRVRDSGCGMAEEVRQRVLEPFFSTKGSGGTGLGLPTVVRVAEGAGGSMSLDSRPGHGTTVEVWLPMLEAPGAANHELAPSAEQAMLSGTVLVVEDELEVREVIEEILSQAGMEVQTASGVEETLQAATQGTVPDLILSDFLLPSANGLTLLRQLRQAGIEAPAILCSGYSTDVRAEDLAAVGAVYLAKPFTRAQLLKTAGACLGSSVECMP